MEDDMENAAAFQTANHMDFSLARMIQMDKREASWMDLDDATGQPPTGFDKEERFKRVSDKCRIKEVDYSAELHEMVYSQMEQINHMRREMEREAQNLQQAHMSSMEDIRKQWEVALREREAQLTKEFKASRVEQHQQLEDYMRRSREAVGHANREVVETSMQKILEDSRKRFEQELAQCEEELNRKKEEEFLEREHARFGEMEQRLKSEVDKLRAEKESELANMEQQFSRSYRLQDRDTEMDDSPCPSAKPLSGTPCLDTIKKLKRIRGISRRTRLVSVPVEADTQEIHQERSFEQDAPRQQHDTSPSASMEDAIARGVEAALKRILIEKEFPLVKKRSPRKKKIEDEEIRREKAAELSCERDFLLGEVRRLFKDVFKIAQDTDFIVHEAASREDVFSYEYEDGPGPDLKNLAFDLKNGSKTPWNSKIVDLLLEEIQKRCDEEKWPFQRSEVYFREILHNRYKRLHMIWTAAQPKVTAKGILETPVEVEKRLITKKDETLKATHQTMRQRNKYRRRVVVVDNLVKQTADENEEDLPAWRWLQRLIKMLGEGGMSSEESDVENDIETVLHVKNMIWRQAVEREMTSLITKDLWTTISSPFKAQNQ
ncbi:uncharacterized protein F5147DRAFT_766328 [Suillus discolor]|uniref:Uncharacterized protein n=1 Tax=Suillus discolor TaxID=1912936 RepID=A0A9P7K0P6_9AGAM|nr:uncharacterized protein F5147DRAFT_766328 [Suillus discolor]KAG2120410.1 hypothetical protein F5147DRAFT_766328 [Suillus discolor]